MSQKGVNKVILLGNVGSIETKYMTNGEAVTKVSIATADVWKDATTNEKKEKTEWHKVVFYRKLAEIAGEYVQKGSKIYVEGKLRTRKWADKDGIDRYTTEIQGEVMQMISSSKELSLDGTESKSQYNRTMKEASGDTLEDDIPF